MHFTPQQLSGGQKFNYKCRIGNWSEDQSLEETKLKDFIRRKEGGSLLVNSKQKKLEKCLQAADLSHSRDGYLHFGHTVMIANHATRCFLSTDPYDRIVKDCESYAVTTGSNPHSTARNVFVLVRPDGNNPQERPDPEDTLIRFGDHFRIMSHEKLDDTRHFLHSETVSPLAAAKVSRFQEVVFYPRATGNTLWKFVHPDSKIRYEMEGEKVPSNCPVVIKHVQTGQFLGSDKLPFTNDFGNEFEVHCHNYLSTNKTHNCYSELKGAITGDIDLRRQATMNVWTIFTAESDPQQSQQSTQMTQDSNHQNTHTLS